MTDAIEKLVKNEIQGQERSELIHDLAVLRIKLLKVFNIIIERAK